MIEYIATPDGGYAVNVITEEYLSETHESVQ